MKRLFVAGVLATLLWVSAASAQSGKETPKAADVGPGGFEMTTY